MQQDLKLAYFQFCIIYAADVFKFSEFLIRNYHISGNNFFFDCRSKDPKPFSRQILIAIFMN